MPTARVALARLTEPRLAASRPNGPQLAGPELDSKNPAESPEGLSAEINQLLPSLAAHRRAMPDLAWPGLASP